MPDMAHPIFVLETKLEPKRLADSGRLVAALDQIACEDSAFGYSRDPASGELIVLSIGEERLVAQLDTLRRTCGVEFMIGAPQISFREALNGSADVDHTHERRIGPTLEFARVSLAVAPRDSGAGNRFRTSIVGGAIPEKLVSAIEEGVRSIWRSGVLVGFPMVDTDVALLDAADNNNCNPATFEIAARSAMEKAAKQAGMKLLEPIMDVEILTPGDVIGSVIGDINSRRGWIINQTANDSGCALRAHVPMARMLGYFSDLRAITEGRGSYQVRFDHYEEVQRRDGPEDLPPAVAAGA